MHIQGRWRRGWAGGAVKELTAMETYVCFCSITMLTAKIITEIIDFIVNFPGVLMAA